ncbi:cupin domain-containing protein [Actinosynnema sp. NPDC047251]|uniref:Cupin type-2 domain-containing protein n=1 Tax=Saccharothrix espanaensis (strain ATCC 51144 / DSM 44229 / JCM 9112 / NBRC 15066 / NRRL 15764) TaxID=1179773 RepID=K0JW79_SACES|nr:cupin domain-containing protein [Saccharothrix espanaensis]CCH29727.1 hypothetical protein BN6_24130 [Saccharothrix espanaensis DSM 44229]
MFRNESAEVVRLAGGSRFELLADGPDTGGVVGANRLVLDVGADGAKPHFHARSSEVFYVLGGVLEVLVGDRRTTVAEGGLLVVPPTTPHAFGAAAGSPADVLVVMTPGVRRFGYFRHLGRIAAGTDTFENLVPRQEEYDVHFVDLPDWRSI